VTKTGDVNNNAVTHLRGKRHHELRGLNAGYERKGQS
jgi:hypothetical protein